MTLYALFTFITISTVTVMIIMDFLAWAGKGVQDVKTLHEIPCSRCRYFTGEYHLKCPVNPRAALTEAAIDCLDFVGEYYVASISARAQASLKVGSRSATTGMA